LIICCSYEFVNFSVLTKLSEVCYIEKSSNLVNINSHFTALLVICLACYNVIVQGVLTLPNGDYIEGQFSGSFSDGIKVNGMFRKAAVDHAMENRMVSSVGNLPFPKYIPYSSLCNALIMKSHYYTGDFRIERLSVDIFCIKWDVKLQLRS